MIEHKCVVAVSFRIRSRIPTSLLDVVLRDGLPTSFLGPEAGYLYIPKMHRHHVKVQKTPIPRPEADSSSIANIRFLNATEHCLLSHNFQKS